MITALMVSVKRGYGQEIRQGQTKSSAGSSNVLFEQNNAAGSSSGESQAYYFKKILENEIAFLKTQLQAKEKEAAQLLEKKQNEYEQLMQQQRVAYEQQLNGQKQTTDQEKTVLQEELKKLQAEYALEKARRQALEEAAKTPSQLRRGKDKDQAAAPLPPDERLEQVMAERHTEQVAWEDQRKNYEKELQGLRTAATKSAADTGQLALRVADQDARLGELQRQKQDLETRLKATSTAGLREQENDAKAGDAAQTRQQIAALEQQLSAGEQARAQEKQAHANALREQQSKYEQQLKDAAAVATPEAEALAKEYEAKLTAKYQQFDQALREKDQAHAVALESKQKELDQAFAKSDEREKALRKMLAEKELTGMQEKDEVVGRLTKERDELRQASEQMKLYQGKLKDELSIKTTMIAEKDEYITELNRKVLFYENVSGEAKAMDKDPGLLREETARLKSKVEDLTVSQEQNKRRYEATIEQQKEAALKTQKDHETALANNDFAWEKKLQLVDERYRGRIKELEKDTESGAAEMETKLREVSEKLRKRVKDDEEARQKMSSFRASQLTLLEDMLASKVALVSSLDAGFRTPAAQAYFDQALNSLKQKNYATARQQLQQALSLEEKNTVARNMLESVEFLLERKN